jgi:hypothetical protein
MEIKEYLLKVFGLNPLVYTTLLTLLAIPTEHADTNGAINRVKGKLIGSINGEEFELSETVGEFDPVVDSKTKISLPANTLLNQPEAVETNVGRAIANSIMLVYPFGDTFKFINDEFSIPDVESMFTPMLGKEVSVKDHLKFKQSCDVVGQLTRIIVHSATPKNIVAPKGLKEFKKALIAKYEKDGKSLQNPVYASQFKGELSAFDDEYLKDDPSLNVFISGKVKKVSRSKVQLAYGQTLALGSGAAPVMTRSLSEGVVHDKESLVQANNSLRAGSVSRGKDIVVGGVTATLLGRIVSHLAVANTDCKTKDYVSVFVRPKEARRYEGRAIQVNGKLVVVDDDMVEKIRGTTIKLRSILRCKDPVMCKVCSGERMAARPNSLGLGAFDLSARLVKASLRKFHGVTMDIVKVSIDDFT